MVRREGLHASVFGAVGLSVDDNPVELRGRQRRRIVAVLLSEAGRPVAVSRLVDILDLTTSTSTAPSHSSAATRAATTDPANAVQAQVRRLRELIEPGVPARSASRLRSTPEGYVLDPDGFDLWDYEAAIRSAREMTALAPGAAAECYCAARALWSPPWGDLGTDPLVAGLVSHLEEQHRTVEEEWGELILDLGQGPLVADELMAMARHEPSRERRWAAAIRGLFQASRQADALRVFDEARTTLREEFGVDPGPELSAVEQAVLRQDHVALGARRSDQTAACSRTPELTSFVGRETELSLLDEAIDQHRVVTVVGLGGVGKSRLVTEWSAGSAAGATSHFVDLRGVEHGADIGRRIADDMGLGTAGEDQIDPLDLVVASFATGRSPLMVDNAEHLAEDLAQVLLRLIDAIPALRVVITSRVPMGITGEFTVRVDPLRIPEDDEPIAGTAAQLVVDRLGPGAEESVARSIARRFGGLPLPLELVAASQDHSDDPDGPETVRADAAIATAVDIALEQVSPHAEHLLWRCLQFPDGASVALLRTVAPELEEGERDSTARLLRELVGASLLSTSPSPTGVRYRGLQPLSELAARRLDPRDHHRVIRDAVSWWGSLSRTSFFDPPDLGGIRALESDHRNIGAALDCLMDDDPLLGLRLVVETTDHWSVSGRWAEARRWIDLGLSRSEPDDRLLTAARATYWYCSGGIPSVAAEQHLIEAAIEQIGDADSAGPDVWAVLHLLLGVSRAWNGDLTAGNRAIDTARRTARESGSVWFLATIDRFSALGHLISGDPLAGVSIAIEAADRLEALDDPSSAAGSLYNASLLGRAGGLVDQTDILLRARLLAEVGGSPGIRALVAIEVAQNARRLGHEDATDQLDRAATLTEVAGNLRTAAVARRDLGLMLLDLGRRDAAAKQLRRSIRPLLRLDRRAAALSIAALAEVTTVPCEMADRLRGAAWSMSADPSGAPPTEANLDTLRKLAGHPPDPLPTTAAVDAAIDELLRGICADTPAGPSKTTAPVVR